MDPNNTPVVGGNGQTPPSAGGRFSFFKNAGKKKLAGIIAVAVILIGGGVAGGYYGIIVPNQPQNVLKKSAENLLKQDQTSGKGHATISSKGNDSEGTFTADYEIKSDSNKNAFEGKFDVSASGVKLPVEVKYVDKAAYVKVGDLSTIESLVGAFAGPESSAVINQLSAKVSNKWIEFDESLIKSASDNKCSVLEQQKLNDDQINQLLDMYDSNMFVTVKNTSSETVDGKKVTKYELGLDQNKAKDFAKQVEQMDYFKKLKECAGEEASKTNTDKAEDFKGDATFNVWIDKGKKQIVKIQLAVKDETADMTADFIFNNDKVDITKPQDSIPAMQLYGDIASIFTGGVAGSTGGGSSDLETKCSQEIIASVQNGAALSAECETLYGGN